MTSIAEIESSFWSGKRVFITGHTGFKGTWLASWLCRLGAHVTGYALPPDTSPSLFYILRLDREIDAREGDIRDIAAMEEVVRETKPEIVFHLAAQPIVRRSYLDPVGTYATNVLGTVNVLEVTRRVSGVRALVVVTSDKCYENQEWEWAYRETDSLGGKDPYSNSKACAELVVSAYRSSFFDGDHGVRVATARSGNVIGGGDWSEHRLVPDLMRALSAGRVPEIRNPRATRPWQHVLEPLRGYLLLASALWDDEEHFSSAWNFGPEDSDARPVGWISDQVCAIWGAEYEWSTDGRTYPYESTLLRLDSARARQELGWQPILRLPEALAWTVGWYRDYYEGRDMARLTHAQIREFEARMSRQVLNPVEHTAEYDLATK